MKKWGSNYWIPMRVRLYRLNNIMHVCRRANVAFRWDQTYGEENEKGLNES